MLRNSRKAFVWQTEKVPKQFQVSPMTVKKTYLFIQKIFRVGQSILFKRISRPFYLYCFLPENLDNINKKIIGMNGP